MSMLSALNLVCMQYLDNVAPVCRYRTLMHVSPIMSDGADCKIVRFLRIKVVFDDAIEESIIEIDNGTSTAIST